MDEIYRNIVVLVVLQLMEKDDLGFLKIEDLKISHQPKRLRLSNLDRNSLEGEVVISQNISMVTLNSRGLTELLRHKGKDQWFNEGGGEDDYVDGTMMCLDLLTKEGFRIIRSLRLDRRKENLDGEGYGDSKSKSSLYTSFEFVQISREDLRRKVEHLIREGRDQEYED